MSVGNVANMKRKLRALKRLELSIRFGGQMPPHARLVWTGMFDASDIPTGKTEYSLYQLAAMAPDEYRAVLDTFFARVYYALYKEKGIGPAAQYSPDALAKLSLAFDADEAAIKQRFRTLAKAYHPDAGGNDEDFIRLMEIYRTLISK